MQRLKYILSTIFILLQTVSARALPVTHYAEQSVLANGKWYLVRVTEDGMHTISNATLRNMGFSDPSKVWIYGTGGIMEPEALSASMADDVPPVPVSRTSKGLVFRADASVGWKWQPDEEPLLYAHQTHPYSDVSYYYISDVEPATGFGTIDMRGTRGQLVTTFPERMLHETEQTHLGQSGRIYVGEDFRANKKQTFSFSLPGLTGDHVWSQVCFYSKVTNGTTDLAISAGGEPMKRADSEAVNTHVPANNYSSTSNYGYKGLYAGKLPAANEKLELELEFGYSGVLFLANLDYIEVHYEREMKLVNGELKIHGNFEAGQTLVVRGVEDGTCIWDITDRFHPLAVTFDREGDTAYLTIPEGGFRELAAYTPEKASRTTVTEGRLENQNLHGMEAPDMLIITPATYLEGAEIIAAHHRKADGMRVTILDPELIYNEFSGGKTDVSAWRKLLKMWYDRGGAPRYVLIMGKPSYDNKYIDPNVRSAGYRPVPIWQSATGLSETSSFSNDDYIGMLDDVEENAFYMSRAKIHVAVGRLPVKNAEEAMATAQKIVNHIEQPNLGAWRNKVMLIADDGDSNDHINQAEECYARMRGSGNGSSYLYDRVYLDSYPLVYTATGATYPQATARMLNNFNEGVGYTNYIGHASESGWGHEHLWTWDQIKSITNPNLSFILAATCRFNPWDEPGESGGELLMLNTKGGVSGMIVASRTVFIGDNGELNRALSNEMFKTDENGLPVRLGDVYINAKNQRSSDSNKLRYVFMGDPAMRLNNIRFNVSVDRINEQPVGGETELPVVEAGTLLRLSGTIRDHDGNRMTDFNGTVAIQLYDAETVIETNGNNGGFKKIYNDRTTRLATASTPVRGGEWSMTINVPLEISNNYLPALVSAYAWDKEGREANGYSEQLYVYGFSDEVSDTEGPVVKHFYLNRETFKDGDIVNPNPVAFIRLWDASGINVSDAGVGHRISLRLDDRTPYDDVPNYFTQDIDDTGGTIIYGLQDLAPGRHTLTLEAWDNMNNSTRQTLSFQVSANADPYIVNIGTDCNPATSGVTFKILLDQPNTLMDCRITVYDLNGRTVWDNSMRDSTGESASVSAYWNLADKSGNRVPRGIYLYKARVETPQGTWSTKTGKLAVTAQ